MFPLSNLPPPGPVSESFSEQDRRTLLEIARHAILEAVNHQRRWRPESIQGKLAALAGAFVTVSFRGRLRGCVGVAEARDSLALTVAGCAASAATKDTRFKQIMPDEVAGVAIEISILSPLAPIQPEQIKIGRHGLVVELGSFRGLLLPQVPVEHRWTRERFLAETCAKAGLPEEAWKSPGALLLGFTAEIITESGNASESTAASNSVRP
jgi:AmmeMemoRadiSam system protein A